MSSGPQMFFVDTQEIALDAGEHVVQFYERDADLLAAVGPHLSTTLALGDVAVVLATPAHMRAFEAELEQDDVDVAQARADGLLISLDAADAKRRLLRDGAIDRDAFDEVVGGAMRAAATRGRPVFAFGEVVALLWESGAVLAAIELERLWNELAAELSFSLFCGYPASTVSPSEHTHALHEICDLHTRVRAPSAVAGPAGGAPAEVEVTARFPVDPLSAGRARRLAVSALRRWGHTGVPVEDAALIVSELATNAIVHARSSFSMAVRRHGRILSVAVRDSASRSARERSDGLPAKPGRGLGLVAAMALRWGVEDFEAGKSVWAELALDAPPACDHGSD